MWSQIMFEKIAAGEDALDSFPSTGSQQKAGSDTGLLSCVIGSPSDNLTPAENIFQDSDDCDIESPDFIDKCQQFVERQEVVSVDDRKAIEMATRGQSSNPAWFTHRSGRITASVIGQITRKRDQIPPDNLLKKIFMRHQPTVTPAACKHGLQLESEARDVYVKHYTEKGHEVSVIEKGLLIDKVRPWLAVSVDGYVEQTAPNKETGLVEIKCPYVPPLATNVPKTVLELASKRRSFYLKEDGSINKGHDYYYQIQTQMGVADELWCDFVVYYKDELRNICDMLVTRVPFDKPFYDNVLTKVEKFYLEAVVPEILTKRVQRGKKLYQNSTRYKYNGKENA